MVCVADAGNRRIQVFDGDGNFKTMFINVGADGDPAFHQGPSSTLRSNSNPPNDIDVAGEIYKLDLTGKLVGKFGRAGRLLKEFGTVNEIDCRNPNELFVAELVNWRVQKLTLRPARGN